MNDTPERDTQSAPKKWRQNGSWRLCGVREGCCVWCGMNSKECKEAVWIEQQAGCWHTHEQAGGRPRP